MGLCLQKCTYTPGTGVKSLERNRDEAALPSVTCKEINTALILKYVNPEHIHHLAAPQYASQTSSTEIEIVTHMQEGLRKHRISQDR